MMRRQLLNLKQLAEARALGRRARVESDGPAWSQTSKPSPSYPRAAGVRESASGRLVC